MAVETRPQQAAAGPGSPSAALVDRYFKDVYMLSFRILGRREDAEDAAQQTFLALFQRRARLDGLASEKAWVMTVARNTAISLGRARRRPSLLVESAFEAPPIDGPPADPERLQLAMAALSEEERHLLLMRFQEGKTPAEMGQAIGKSAGAAATSLSRALARLRQLYHGEPS